MFGFDVLDDNLIPFHISIEKEFNGFRKRTTRSKRHGAESTIWNINERKPSELMFKHGCDFIGIKATHCVSGETD